MRAVEAWGPEQEAALPLASGQEPELERESPWALARESASASERVPQAL